MPTASGQGFVDYVLRGADGKPLGLVEAKRTRKDARVGQQQAKLYADCLERQYGQRPVIFCTNGYEHWIWDDVFATRRAPIQGFLTKRRAGADDPAPDDAKAAGARPSTTPSSSAPISTAPFAGSPRRSKRSPAQGAAGHGYRRGQDPHGHRAERPADARQLGEERALPRRPGRVGPSGGKGVQEASCPARRP